MNLSDELRAAGLSPPPYIKPNRWVRFPGVGKGRSNRSGWCRIISPTMAIYGDWSSDLRGVWKDDTHRDDAEMRRILRESQERERRFAAQQRVAQEEAAKRAQELLSAAVQSTHPYLAAKGFPSSQGLVFGEHLLVPVRDAHNQRLISLQQINPEGEKRFLHGARARGGIYRLGSRGKTLLCEGYATGLSLYEAGKRLYRQLAVIVCFSANNLVTVAHLFPDAIVCADHDETATGEQAAKQTGLKWIMPPNVGQDFNDVHLHRGIFSVVDLLRSA